MYGADTVKLEILVGIKFGGLVRDCYTYIYKYEILADFNLVIAKLHR